MRRIDVRYGRTAVEVATRGGLALSAEHARAVHARSDDAFVLRDIELHAQHATELL